MSVTRWNDARIISYHPASKGAWTFDRRYLHDYISWCIDHPKPSRYAYDSWMIDHYATYDEKAE